LSTAAPKEINVLVEELENDEKMIREGDKLFEDLKKKEQEKLAKKKQRKGKRKRKRKRKKRKRPRVI